VITQRQGDSVLSQSAYTNDVIDLTYKLMEHRNQEISHRLEKVRRAASMLHLDALLLIQIRRGKYHRDRPVYLRLHNCRRDWSARVRQGKKIFSAEPGGRLKHTEQEYLQRSEKEPGAIWRSRKRYFD